MTPEVFGDRVVWQGHEGGFWQVFTQKIGVDALPVQLTNDQHGHGTPRLSGDRLVWTGSDGVDDQVFRAKLVTTPSVARSPKKWTVTVKRKKKVARYTLSAVVRDTDGTLVGGARVYLQVSKNGKTKWKKAATLRTNAAGKVAKQFKSRKKSKLYYRWYVPVGVGYNKVYSGRQRVIVK